MSQHLRISGSSARSMCPIQVLAFMSQHLCISGSSARSMSPDPCLNIHISQELLQDPCLRFMSYSILIIRFCGPAQAKRRFWAPETRFVWPCAGKTVRPSVSRRRNANFELPRCIFCGPAQAKRKFHLRRRVLCPHHVDSRGVTTEWTKIATALQRDAKKNPSHGFAQAKRKFWPPESRFLWPCAVKNEGDRNLHLDLRGFTLTVRTPQCDTLFGEKNIFVQPSQTPTVPRLHSSQTVGPSAVQLKHAGLPGSRWDSCGCQPRPTWEIAAVLTHIRLKQSLAVPKPTYCAWAEHYSTVTIFCDNMPRSTFTNWAPNNKLPGCWENNAWVMPLALTQDTPSETQPITAMTRLRVAMNIIVTLAERSKPINLESSTPGNQSMDVNKVSFLIGSSEHQNLGSPQ